jgi:thiamine kinase-like enzyme
MTVMMKIGEGATAADRAAEAAIAQIGAWAGMEVQYQRIPTGITNLNWKLHVPAAGRDYFMKLHGANTEIFIDRPLAHEAALMVGLSGHAPRLVHYVEAGQIEIYEFLEGYRSCNVSDLFDPEIRGNIVRAYRDIHRGALLSRAKTGFEQLDERFRQAQHHGAVLPRDLDYLLWQSNRARLAFDHCGLNLATCFNDGYVSNYMVAADKSVKIIDWEYAANNDPYWDLALLSFENFFPPETIREMIAIHDGAYTPQAEAKVILNIGLTAVTWGFWAGLQSKISTIPFDFAKYADLLFLRARHQMRQASWEDALAML